MAGSIADTLLGVYFFRICPIIVLYVVLQRIVRSIKKDPSFSFFKLIFKTSEQKGFEAKLGGDTVALKTAKDLSGVVFGKQGGKYATMPETTDGHVLIVGGAGSGKTAAVAIPTLMSWKERVFAIDIKGELYAKTKKARGEAQIKVFNPTDTTAYGYDPFYMLKNADDISSAARQLAMSIVPLPADVKDPFWIKGAQNMLTGFLIYFQGLGESFSSTMKYIKSIPTKELIEQIVADTNEKAKMEIMQFSGMDDKTLSGVYAELSNHITVFATSDDLQRALSGEGACITPADLESGYDIYCCIPEHKLDEWKDLLGMMCKAGCGKTKLSVSSCMTNPPLHRRGNLLPFSSEMKKASAGSTAMTRFPLKSCCRASPHSRKPRPRRRRNSSALCWRTERSFTARRSSVRRRRGGSPVER